MNNEFIRISDLSPFSGKTVDELIEIIKAKEAKSREDEKERYENERRWFMELKGRYFLMNFNNYSYSVVHVVNEISGQMTKQPTYNIHKSNDEFMIQYENRAINCCWYNNPYEKPYYGKGSLNVTEITEEQWNDIEKLYRATQAMFEANEILNMKK